MENKQHIDIDKKQAAFDEQVLQARRIAAATQEIGQETLNSLNAQNETLEKVEDTLEANEYVLLKSIKALRGMTWSGALYNLLTPKPTPTPTPTPASSTSTMSTSTSSSSTSSYSSSSSLSSSSTSLLTSKNSNASVIENNNNNCNHVQSANHLGEIETAVESLKTMSLIMREQLDTQKELLERIDDKTTTTHDRTLEVTLKAAQITTRSMRFKSGYVGRFQFIEPYTGRFLGTSKSGDDNLILLPKVNRSSFFLCFHKEGQLFALQNEKTLKFLGCTMLGQVKVCGASFGKYEELHLSLKGDPTGILILSRNWGGGGWIKFEEKDEKALLLSYNSASSGNSGHNSGNINDNKKTTTITTMQSSSSSSLSDIIILSSTTTSVSDKQGMAIFHAIKVADAPDTKNQDDDDNDDDE